MSGLPQISLRVVWIALWTCLAVFVPGTARVSAQGFGSITGSIADPTGAIVPGAAVTVSERGTGLFRTVTSTGRGQYAIRSLRPSEYKLLVELPGFRPFSRDGILLLADQALVIDVRLELGTSTETVTVQGGVVQ